MVVIMRVVLLMMRGDSDNGRIRERYALLSMSIALLSFGMSICVCVRLCVVYVRVFV